MATANRDHEVQWAKLAEQAERYDDMAQRMKQVKEMAVSCCDVFLGPTR